MKRPFETILDLNLKSLEKVKKDFTFNFNQTDKILVWIVGFSITAIGLIVSKFSVLSNNYSQCVIKWILILLTISIIFGIIYRISALVFLSKFQRILYYLESAFSNHKIMPIETKELTNPNDIYEIYQKIKKDYNEDYIDVVNLFNNVKDENSKAYYIKYLKSEYKRLADWALNERNIALEYVKDAMKDAFDLKEKEMNKLLKRDKDAVSLKIWRRIGVFSIISTLISFILVIILLAYNY